MAKVIFLHLSVILFTGGVSTRENPPCQKEPPRTSQTPPGADTTPPAQTDLPTPGSRHPPRSRHHPPPGPGRPPPEADFSLRSTSGRYASYWNAFLFVQCNESNIRARRYCTGNIQIKLPTSSFGFRANIKYHKRIL